MEWQGEATAIARRRHGEHAVILTVLARDAGLISGVVPGGASVKRAAMLQPGNRLSLRWRARLDDQLGSFSAEPARARPGLMADADALAGLNAVTALISWALPERDPHPQLTDATEALLDAIEAGIAVPGGGGAGGGLSAPRATAVASFAENGPPDRFPGAQEPRGYFGDEEPTSWAADYLRWELLLLDELGFGLSLDRCAVSGAREGLAGVSPRTGHAVTAAAAGEWAPRLLPLPAILGGPAGAGGLAEALALTGHFLTARLAEGQVGRPLPPARARLLTRLGAGPKSGA
ncbi:DNA repair protein RecO [Paracoccus alkenifer]|uniref:DNA repair protein RecO n=1 Tax=Paracoccus alkenifer TaxID=65735 RepID=A0A1H6JZU3_9RHOB|nr:DNA repair protein RecO C-terminal domain-containing protein [Paracoccus alkenifer]SEH64867.1 DNA replication and repair protein RecO [Paracoccus alkenifer]